MFELGESPYTLVVPFEMLVALLAVKLQNASQASTGVILVAANSRVNRRLVSALLQKRGYPVIAVGDGVQALDALEQHDVRLLLMDVQMPRLDGIEVTRRIRQDSRWADLPVVAMTAGVTDSEEQSCLNAGMNGFLTKPIHATHLFRVVEEFARFSQQDSASV